MKRARGFPPSDSDRIHVSIDSRYGGTCFFFFVELSIRMSMTRRRVGSEGFRVGYKVGS